MGKLGAHAVALRSKQRWPSFRTILPKPREKLQVAAEQQLCDMELLPSRLLSTMLARCLRRKTRRASIK